MSEKTVLKEEILEQKDFVVELSGLIDHKLLNTNLDNANFLVKLFITSLIHTIHNLLSN